MEKKKMKKFVVICSIMLLVFSIAPTVFADIKDYDATFPKYQQDTFIQGGWKEKMSTDKAVNYIDGPSLETCGVFWIDLMDSGQRMSSQDYCKYGLNYINYTSATWTGRVRLRGKSATFCLYTNDVSGTIDFS